MCIAVAIGAAAVIGAGASLASSSIQAGAENNATATQAGMYNATVGREAPFVQSGQEAQTSLNNLLGIGTPSNSSTYGSLNAPFTASTFQSMSPAYQFQLQQGGQGVLNQDSSSQGAESGAALKDLISFNQNYANTSFNNAFNQYQTQQTNTFNRLNSIAQTGQSAASNAATGGSQYASGIANTTVGAGTAAASGAVGAANALGSGATNAAIWSQYGGGGAGNGYYTNAGGQTVFDNVVQNGGVGGGIGNIVDSLPADATTSDRRLKKNITATGQRGPLTLYEYHYLHDEDDAPKRLGYMADEVQPYYPDAVLTTDDGYLALDYRKLPHV